MVRTLQSLRAPRPTEGATASSVQPRIAIVGIGNEQRGDDGAGVAVVRGLSAIPHSAAHFLVDAGTAPESCTGPLRRFSPDLVLLVDAAHMQEPPGTVRWLAWEDTSGLSASTHTLPPYMLAKYLAAELGCQVALLGIQPTALDFGAPVSAPVRRAVRLVVERIGRLLQEEPPA